VALGWEREGESGQTAGPGYRKEGEVSRLRTLSKAKDSPSFFPSTPNSV
jgi:hypothetical protein